MSEKFPTGTKNYNSIIVFCTVPHTDIAEKITAALIQGQHAACITQTAPIQSTYLWRGKVQRDSEILLTIKTLESKFETIRTCILNLHPYEVPEIIACPITYGHADYLHWIESSVKDSAKTA